MSTPAAPVAQAERIRALDVLRGFALLGILVMNIRSFSMPTAAYLNPTVYGDFTGLNYWVWWFSHVFGEAKLMSIFSMLFGAGVLLFSSRLEARGQSPRRWHYRRMLWLILFGMAHAYLLWYGDILYLYGVCGLFIYLLRKRSPKTLIVIGLILFAVSSGLFLLMGWSMPYWPADAMEDLKKDWNPSQAQLGEELAQYRGGWLEQMAHRAPTAFEFETFFVVLFGWQPAGLMLIGMALFKLGFFSAERPARDYWTMLALGALVGVPLAAYGVHRNLAEAWSIKFSFFYGTQFNYWASLLIALGWVGLVMLVVQRNALGWLTARLSAVGQMAFTNYLLQTILCTTIFYGHGFGYFGRLERTEQFLVVVGVWIVQLIASPLWLARFRFGPFEWLWRSLTYGAAQPFRRAPA